MIAALVLILLPAHPDGDLRRSAVVEVVEKAGPAVVNIGAEILEQNPFRRGGFEDQFFREFFGERTQRTPRTRTAQSLGSGVIIDKSGLVLTNEHVISRATSITVTLKDRRNLPVDVVAADPAFDIAVLKVRNASDLPAAELGTSADLMAGETVVAIGNPFGLSNTVTVGVVSALHRSVTAEQRTYEDFVQTDAAINPGNSGGALLNLEGRLIGINTAIYGGGTGIGFAIPIDKARAVVQEVLKYGEVRPVFLGLSVESAVPKGARIRRVDRESSAGQGGLLVEDVITDVGGQEVTNAGTFTKLERSLIPGQKVRFTVLRQGSELSLQLVAKELTREQAVAIGRERLGLEVQERQGGLVISGVAPKSEASAIGIKKGDHLLSMAGRAVRNQNEFEAICAALHGADAVAVIIGRQGRHYYVSLSLQ